MEKACPTNRDATFSHPHPCPECHYAGLEERDALCPACLLAGVLERGEMGGLEDDEMPDDAGLPRCGDYRITEILARGASGVIYRAQARSGKEVAIKMLASGKVAEPDGVRRFRLEAEMISQLDHPNIVPLYDAGECDGQWYFVMKLARGGSLAQRLAADPGGMAQDEAANLVSRVARAVEHAHERGVLHRDIKPANILLDDDGTPLVSDFGLGRRTGGQDRATITGMVLGTPSYMAPEQAQGADWVTTAADVYGLGAVLYHLLGGRAPFEAATALEVMRQLSTEDPAPLCTVNPGIPRDLATICHRCLEKIPSRRYRSAAELADDLDRWRAGENVLARPAAWPERMVKWFRRRPVVAALASSGMVAVAALAGILIKGNEMLRGERNAAVASERETARHAYAADMFLARRDLDDGNLGAARMTVSRHVPAAGAEDLRGFEWHVLERQCQGDEAHVITRQESAITAVAFSPDGTMVATGSRDGRLDFWSMPDGRNIRSLPRNEPSSLKDLAVLAALPVRSPELAEVMKGGATLDEVRMRGRASKLGEITAIAWSPDGKWLLTGGSGCYARLWRVADGSLHGIIPILRVVQAEFTPDSAEIFLAVGTGSESGGELLRYDRATLTRRETVALAMPCFTVARRAPRFAYPVEGGLCVRSLAAGSAPEVWNAGHQVHALAMSADGTRLAECGLESGLLRDGRDGRVLAEIHPGQGALGDPRFSADGRTLAVATAAQAIAVFDGVTGEPLRKLRGHEGEILALDLEPRAGRVLSGGIDRTARLWEKRDGGDFAWTSVPSRDALVAASDDGTWLLGEDEGGRVTCQPFPGGPAARTPARVKRRALAVIGGGGDKVCFLTLQPDSGKVEWWHADATPAGPALDLPEYEDAVAAVCPATGHLVRGHGRQPLTLHDVRTGKALKPLPPPPVNLVELMFSPDGRYLCAKEFPRTVAVADVAAGKWLWVEHLSGGPVGPVVFSPDSRWLASGGEDAVIAIRAAADGKVIAELRGHLSEVGSLAFSANGRTLASASKDETLRLWHTPTWRPLGTLLSGNFYGGLRFTGKGLFVAEYGTRWLLLGGK